MEVAESQKILLPGDLIGNYRIDNFLGQGGFGITYLAHDTMLDIKVAIKEYLPERIAQRLSQHTVRPRSADDADVYRKGLDNFLKEARTLARFDHPNIVGVRSVFEHGGTAYMVMDYEHGRNLKFLFDKRKLTTEASLKSIVGPLLDGLEQVHRHGFIHRDIKPANIIMRRDRTPVLLDFGSARLAVGQYTADLTAVVTSGFAPLEQYSGLDDQQGPWSDIYAMGAVVYYAITGSAPEDSTVRGSALLNNRPDPLKSLSDLAPKGYSRSFCAAIDWALAFRVSERPQTLAHWRARLLDSQLHDATEVLRDPVDLDRYRQITSVLNSPRINSDKTARQRVSGPSAADDVTVIAPVLPAARRAERSVSAPKGSINRNNGAGEPRALWGLSRINYRYALALGLAAILVPLAIFVVQQRADRQDQRTADQTVLPTATDSGSDLPEVSVSADANALDINEASSIDSETKLSASESTPATDDIDAVETAEASETAEVSESAPTTGSENLVARISEETRIPESERLEAEQAQRELLEAESEAKREIRLPPVDEPAPVVPRAPLRESAGEQGVQEQQRIATSEPDPEVIDEELAAEHSGIKPPITDTDMFIVLTRFNSLSSAIRDGDGEELRELTILSERKNRFFDYVFRTFDEVDVSIKDITASRWDQTIRATLSIKRMTRSNGDTAFAPDEFKNIPIFSVRDNTWSAIHW